MSTLSRVIFDPDSTPPSTPLSVAANALSQTTIRITWSASTDTGGSGLAGYRVYRSPTSGGTYAQIGTDLSTASLSFDDTTLSAGTQRFYRVLAFDGNGNASSQSSIVNATTTSAAAVLFRADFSNPNANGVNFYNFANKLGNINNGAQIDGQPNWQLTHLATGGHLGGPAVRLTQLANRYQYPMGWDTPALGGSWSNGDEIYYRFIVRIDDASRFIHGIGNKFIDHSSGNSRNIVWLPMAPYDVGGGGGTLGWPGIEGGASHAVPSVYGLTGSWTDGTNGGQYGSINISRGVGFKSSEPALITYGNKSSPPRPGPLGAGVAPVNGWYYVQCMARSGAEPTGSAPFSRYRVWINNNNSSNPTADQYTWNTTEEPAALTATGWSAAAGVGRYAGDEPGPTSDFSYVISALEIGRTFRSDWYPG